MSFLGLQGRWTSQYALAQTADTQTHMAEHPKSLDLIHVALHGYQGQSLYVCVCARGLIYWFYRELKSL